MGKEQGATEIEPLGVTTTSETGRSLANGMALYIHIPFCETKCPYCDFNTYAGINHLIPSYMEALSNELHTWASALGHPRVNTVFLGGGTPSMLSPKQMNDLFTLIRAEFAVQKDAEVSAEVNPDDVTVERMTGFLEAGLNRISIGVQSFDDTELQILGRRHNVTQALKAFEAVQHAGFTNVSMDLMYGLPHQNMESWKRNVEGVITAAPQHVSAYALTLEPETPMAQRAAEDNAIQQFIKTKQPLDGGRIGIPSDLEQAAVYFLGDGSKFTTGQVLSIDGGWSISEGQI